jgi:AraC-like DNA-binding protein
MAAGGEFQQRFLAELDRPFLGEELFDVVPDTVFFLKDRGGRYVAVNQTLVERCGVSGKSDLIGRRAEDVFPAPLGARISEQDARVVRERRAIVGELERHLYPGGVEGWCLTWKEPLVGKKGRVVGLSGISRDLQAPTLTGADAASLARLLDYIRANLDQPLRLPELAGRAKLTVFQLDRRVRALFGLSAGQFVTRARIDLACNRLRQTKQPIAEVALDCGYAGQAAFTRQFRKTVGLTPRAYRERA